jgi:malic enzyme
MSSIPHIPHRASRILLLAGVIVMAAALTQCKMVTDSATRPQVDPNGAGNCISACAHQANDMMREESDLHVANVKACTTTECKQAEADRHTAAVKAIQDFRKSCQDGCHNQGGGKGGR